MTQPACTGAQAPLAELTLSSDAEARLWYALVRAHPPLNQQCAYDPDSRVRLMVAMKRKLTPEVLSKLADDEDESARLRVAIHRNTPDSVLRELADDPWSQIRETAARRITPGS